MSLAIGEIVGDRYRVVQLLGQGGMGAVYRAWDVRLNRPVALKEMIPQAGLDAGVLNQLRSQFEQEARVLATLIHPGLVRVTDYFSWQGNAYLVMDFVEGESLADRIAREGALPEGQVLAWTGQLLDALGYCHAQGIIHRDIKPQNIIVTPDGRAVLVDFGLVKLWDPNDPRTKTVMRGAGTPEYAPPEQYDIGMTHTDPRSDIYSLGATMYQALTGRLPVTATQRMADPSSFLPPRRVNAAVTARTEAAILKALEMAKEKRFQSTAEMAAALGIAGSGTSVRPGAAAVAPVHPAQRPAPAVATGVAQPRPATRPKRGLLAGGLGLVVVGGCLLLLAATVVGLYLVGRGGGGQTQQDTATPTFFPTNTPRPLAPTPVPSGDVLFQDDFSDRSSGWEVGDYETGNVGYRSGSYFVTSASKNSAMWGVANRTFDNVDIEVDATQVYAGPTDNNAYGVICREQGNGDGYYLRISGDGFFSIFLAANGEMTKLVEWSKSPAIQQGNATNHLRVICNGPRLTLYVNGTQVAEAEDGTFTQGDIALTATTYEDKDTEIHFDNLVVRRP